MAPNHPGPFFFLSTSPFSLFLITHSSVFQAPLSSPSQLLALSSLFTFVYWHSWECFSSLGKPHWGLWLQSVCIWHHIDTWFLDLSWTSHGTSIFPCQNLNWYRTWSHRLVFPDVWDNTGIWVYPGVKTKFKSSLGDLPRHCLKIKSKNSARDVS